MSSLNGKSAGSLLGTRLPGFLRGTLGSGGAAGSASVLGADGPLKPLLSALITAQAEALEQLAAQQGSKLVKAEQLMKDTVLEFGQSLMRLDGLVRREYDLAMALQQAMAMSGEGMEGSQSVQLFTASILETLNQFVQVMLESGQSSFTLVEETNAIRARSSAMTEALGELAGVASRIQMLGLNASIEAAHARQYGAGFGVVAGEVQKLAVQSARISDLISGMVMETQAALERTSLQVERIASKDLDEVIQSKQQADAMAGALERSDRQAQELVGHLEQVGREVRDQVSFCLSALQFEDLVRQMLEDVATSADRMASFALRLRGLAEDLDGDREPLEDLLAQATLVFTDFSLAQRTDGEGAAGAARIELF